MPIMADHIFISNSPEKTFDFGKKLGKKLQAGTVIALTGELGCGKTVFTRGICDGLEVTLKQVSSPTFVLVNEYRGRIPVFHMDMYQLSTEADAVELGIIDYLVRARSGVMVIEWAEKVISLLPAGFIMVEFTVISKQKRRIKLSASSAKYVALLEELM
jgi:tRNA threonylcarbamoyladenosine biosynthesis protein TsaE